MIGTVIHRLDVWIEGAPTPIGTLSGDADTALSFAYTSDGIAGGRSLSLSLPLGPDPVGDAKARAFFGNLLQENDTLRRVMETHRIDRDDIAGLLFHLGRDCAGAVSCVPAGEAPDKTPGVLETDYDPLSDAQITEIMDALARERRLPDAARNPSPLAGVQGKIALCRLPDGRMALPRQGSGVPTTHILKVPRRGEEDLVDQEHALMRLAAGILEHPVSVTEIFELGGARGLLVTRFDRRVEAGTVYRIHQEDFAQALGIPSGQKYGRTAADPFSAAAIGRILEQTAVPVVARAAFRDITLFNLAVGNTDNHAKNHALIYDGGQMPRLAPLYDVVPVLLDRNVNHDFGFMIGNAANAEALRRTDYEAFLEAIGYAFGRTTTARQRQSRAAQRLFEAVGSGAAGLRGMRLKMLADMIVHRVGQIAAQLDVAVDLPQRDAFIPRGGGFLLES